MKIRNLRIQNFRNLRDCTWHPGALNVLIGPNGSGKTNLLRALDLLRMSVEGHLEQALVAAGGLSQVLWNSEKNPLVWDLDSDMSPFVNPTGSAATLRYHLAVGIKPAWLGGSGYQIQDELLANYDKVERGEVEEPFKHIERDSKHAVFFDSEQRKLAAAQERVTETETLLSQVAGLFADPQTYFFQNSITSWSLYRDLSVNDLAEIRKAALTRRETKLNSDGQNLVPLLHTMYTTDREFKNQLNAAMRAAFGDYFNELEFAPAEDQRIQMRVHWKPLRSSHSTAELSDGTLRFLMLIAILANKNRGELVAIDEPETFLHPSMFPAIAELAEEAAEVSQVLFTTHSPQFLDALTSRVPITTVCLMREGATQLSNVDGKELSRWLQKYTLGKLYESGTLETLV